MTNDESRSTGSGQASSNDEIRITKPMPVSDPRFVIASFGHSSLIRHSSFVIRHSPSGFSLVELLVVIGIIALLLAILLPVLAHVRERAEKAKCASNLRQVAAGLEMYNQTNRHLPVAATPAALADVMKGLDIGGIMTCPMDQSGSYSYAMNGAFAGLPKSAGDPTDVLASESVARHAGKANVVYFDGHVDEK